MPGNLDQRAACRPVASLGDGTLATALAGGVFAGREAEIGHELARVFEALEAVNLGHQRHGGDELDATHGLQRLDQWPVCPVLEGVAQGLFETADAGGGVVDGMQVFLEDDLLGRLRQLEVAQPAHVRGGPGRLAAVGNAVAQQECLEAVACIALLSDGVVAGANQVADGLVGSVRHVYGDEVAAARQAGQHDGVASVGLDAVGGALGDRRWRDDLAGDAVVGEVAVDDVAAGAGLVDDVQFMALADQAAQCSIEGGKIAADGADVAYFAVAVIEYSGDIDGVFMNIQPDKQSARLLHGSSPLRKVDCTERSIMWLGVVVPTQSTIRSGTGRLNSSHSVYPS